jgi:hypothetical protein
MFRHFQPASHESAELLPEAYCYCIVIFLPHCLQEFAFP